MIAITHRRLCRVPFLEQIERIAAGGPEMVIVREKDLPDDGLKALVSDVWHICSRYEVPVSVNTNFGVARALGIDRVHVPLQVLRDNDLSDFRTVGASVHSPAEAAEAESLGADYLIAGHVFPTACKLGLEPRGTDFIRAVCDAVSVPVYAVGGITPENKDEVYGAGAAGVCVMSSAMTSEDPGNLIGSLAQSLPH